MQTVDPEEIERFSRIASEWWDPNGKFRPLHALNPTRIGWLRGQIENRLGPLEGLKLLDIGCGGGLVAEPFARLGARVTGIDAGEKNIAVAQAHARESGLAIDYRCATAEELAAQGAQYDVVLALEIVEHVADVDAFIAACMALVKPGGLLLLSTLNRTPKAYLLAILGAEYVLRWLPRGTHSYEKFLRPSELAEAVRGHGGTVREMAGMVMHPVRFEWRIEPKDLSVNYLMAVQKD